MTDFLKIAKSIVVHFAHICAYGVETVKDNKSKFCYCGNAQLGHPLVQTEIIVSLNRNSTISYNRLF